jgi:PAS domain S-box-containing protein
MKNPAKPLGEVLISGTDSGVLMRKSKPNTTRKKNLGKDKEEASHEKLLKLHEKIIELEKLDIRRQKGLISAAEMKKACRELLEKWKELIVIIQERKIVCISPPLAKLLGYTQKEMLNTSFANYIHPEELFKVAEYYLKRISGEETPSIYNSILKRRDGKDIHVEIMAGIFPLAGKPADLIIVRELSEQG